MSEPSPVRFLGRYAMHDELASGGMATIHLGRLLGPVGFARTVAIKRLHPQYARDPQFVAMFVDEARLAARIRHQNVVPTLDVVALEGEIFLVMEYVHGESLSRLLAALDARGERVAPPIAAGIMHGVLQGLHAAHEARTEKGVPLEIVHRDVSPQNVLVGIDGLARVADFGVAKAVGRLQTTEDGDVKGKMGYMSPEQVESAPVDRRTDVWAAAVVLWELLMGKRLFGAANAAAVVYDILERTITPPGVGSPALDAVVMRGLARDPGERFQTAREMAMALEEALTPASPRAIGDWVEATARETLRARASLVEEMEAEGGGKRSSDGSLRRQLAVLGFGGAASDAKPSAPPPSSEAPTGQAPGRIRKSDAPPEPAVASSAAPPPPSSPPPPEEVRAPSAPPAPSTPSALAERGRAESTPRSWVGLALVAVVLVLAAAVIALDRRSPSAERDGAPTASSPASPSLAASAPPEAPPSASEGAATLLDASEPRALAPAASSPTVATAATVAIAPSAPSAPRPRSPHAAPDASPHKLDCDPPYTVGPAPDFIRVPKTECLPP